MRKDKIGVVDVGGGFRGVYAAGVMDYCIDQHIQFRIEIYCQGLNMVCHYGIESTHVLESLHQLF